MSPRTTRGRKRRKPDVSANPSWTDEESDFICQILDKLDILQETVNETNDMMKTLVNENIEIKKELVALKGQKNDLNQIRASTYADQVKSNGPVVLITPNDSNQNSATTKEIVKDKINPAESKINGIRRAAKGAIIIECKDKKSSEELHSSVVQRLGDGYKVELPKKRKPKFKLVGMSDRLSDDQVVELLIKQNECLKAEAELKVIKTTEVKDRFNNSKFQAIIETDCVTYKNIMDNGKLYVNWDSCKIYDYVGLVRCFKCLGFNHFSKDCNRQTTCKFCAGNHESSACPRSSSSQEYKCVNCSFHVEQLKMQLDVNHHAFSSECKVLQRKFMEERRKVDLCE